MNFTTNVHCKKMLKLWGLKLHVTVVSDPHNLVSRQLKEPLQLGVPQLSHMSYLPTLLPLEGVH